MLVVWTRYCCHGASLQGHGRDQGCICKSQHPLDEFSGTLLIQLIATSDNYAMELAEDISKEGHSCTETTGPSI